ncbi:MAG: cadherin-like beta sandwich domain-containing protein [Clostridia bacterium]|nr:cadherin-like beta sandwich domain-containing protein [Clostridia bacterium]
MNFNKKITATILMVLTITTLEMTVFGENTTNTTNVTNTTKTNNTTSAETAENTTNTPNTSNTEKNTVTSQNTSQTPKNSTSTATPKQNTTTPSTTTKKETTVTKQTTATKSSNANLNNLGITPHDFSGFKETKTEYNVTVPNNINEVEVYATKKDSKATLEGTGKVKLQEGDNTAKVVVTAEDGTTKTYTINIKRLKSGEKETQIVSNTEIGLENLEITGAQLEPSFNKNVYQYKAKYEGSEKQLDIHATSNANVKIIGNENLVNGQNLVTIIVTDSKETSVATYQIYVNKNMVEQEELSKQFEDAQMQSQIKQWIIMGLIGIIALCVVILLILIYKKSNDEEYQEQKRQKKISKQNEKLAQKENKESKSGKHSK